MHIALSGNIDRSTFGSSDSDYVIHPIVRTGCTLHVGNKCNDGRPITESWKYKQAVKLGVPIVHTGVHPRVPLAKKQKVTKELLVDKYSPKRLSDIIGHKDAIQQLLGWLSQWDHGYPEVRSVLATGPPGIGKTSTIHLVSKELGYHVVEYNASDTRSVSTLRGLIALGVRRLRKEVIVMDEIDGLSEKGGVGELSAILRKTNVPIICIANEKPPKLRPIINVSMDLKFQRPNKITIATSLLSIAKAEGIMISKVELEALCEANGNDIRSILNALEFYGKGEKQGIQSGLKDAVLRQDLFSATQTLFRQKKMSLSAAEEQVFVDYHMVPLMVQEGYLAASGTSLEAAAAAAEHLSFGDTIDRRIHTTQDWGLMPDFVQMSVAATKIVPGLAPFQLFPQWLGKNSKGLKHGRYMKELAEKMGCLPHEMRMDYADFMQRILLAPLCGGDKPDVKGVMKNMDHYDLTRDDIFENLQGVCLDPVDIPTKVKTAFTREYNKTHSAEKLGKTKKKRSAEDLEGEEGLGEEEDMEELEDGMEDLKI
jgi:replication factor C subunit 1